jgi:hypothetical protein
VPNAICCANIRVAALLCVDDYLAAARRFAPEQPEPALAWIVLPATSFDVFGRDLTCRHYAAIEHVRRSEFGLQLEARLDRDSL